MNRQALCSLLVLALVGCSSESTKEVADNSKADPKPAGDISAAKPPAAEPSPAKPDQPATPPASAPPAGASGTWKRVGKEGAWKPTRLAAVVGEQLFSLERGEGTLWKTDLRTGTFTTIGKPDYQDTKFLLGGGDAVYTIETGGTLYRINPDDGSWATVGKEGDWTSTRLAVIHGDHLFTIERGDGRLFKTELATGKFTSIGKPDYQDTKWLLSTASALITIETDGSMFHIDPADGSWKRVGKEGDWKNTRLATTLGDYLYTIERGDGRLFKTEAATGTFSTIGKGDYGDSRIALGGAGAIFTIEADGNLFRIEP